jgi:hypothetical protein
MSKQITVDDEVYIRKSDCKSSNSDSPVKIVILQRGWCVVGRFKREGNDCTIENASVIRTWGTTKGLGEIAENGPTSSTKLDPFGTGRFDYLTVVLAVDCEEDKWSKHLS